MGNIVAFNPCTICEKEMCSLCELNMYRQGILRQEKWISVDERLPEETSKTITFQDQDIVTSEITAKEERIVKKSKTVAVIAKRCMFNKIEVFLDIDYTIDGQWANNMWVTHWMPLPEPPKKEGE